MNRKIIGISGAFGSGKSTAADFLTQKGYTRISLVSLLEEELVSRGETNITRQMLQDLGNEWREKDGAGVLGKKAAENIIKNNLNLIVVEGFRNIKEIDELKKIGEFTLIALLVNRKIRYDRLVNLRRRENLTPELFEKLDYRDMGIGENANGLQVAICVAIADIFLENNKTEKDLEKRLGEIVKQLNG